MPLGSLGARGEAVAERYLRSQGFSIVRRSYRSPLGEIDLIARDHGQLVFVEVRTRSHGDSGSPWETVNSVKQRKLSSLAVYFLKHETSGDESARFDVVGVEWPGTWWQAPRVDHFRDAFPLRGPWTS